MRQDPATSHGWRPRRILLCCIPFLLLGQIALAQRPERAIKASIQLLSDRTAFAPGQTGRLATVMKIERGWHTNSHEPTFDYLIGTELQLELPAGWKLTRIDYPTGEMAKFAFADEPISVYDGKVTIMSHLEVPPDAQEGTWPVEASVHFQACDDRSCLPPVTTTAKIDLVIGTEGEISQNAVFAEFSPATGAKSSSSLIVVLLLGTLGGLILNAMPCVLPVLSLKVFGLVKSAEGGNSQVVFGSLATAMGILLSFWALALAAVVAKSAGAAVGWGVQFQEPTFVVILAIIVILFCLNLWGLFEIPLPGRLARLADSGPKEGVAGHLVSGLFATLMATPCSAPFLGTAVGFALSQSAAMIFAVFTAIAIGMALPYLILAAAPNAARLLPKPGPWMDQVRIVMGFLLAAAAVWLFYVLAAQMTRERVAFIELALLAMALFIWMRHQATTGRPARLAALAGIGASIAIAVGLASGATGSVEVQSAENTVRLINWAKFDKNEVERLVDEGRMVFVDVTADWCFTCKVNERLVLETEEIADAFRRFEVVPMKADWTNRDKEISDFLAEHGRYGIPFYLLYRPPAEPHLFSELLSKEAVIEILEESVADRHAAIQ